MNKNKKNKAQPTRMHIYVVPNMSGQFKLRLIVFVAKFQKFNTS